MRHFASLLLATCATAAVAAESANADATTTTTAAAPTSAKPMTVQLEVPVGNRSVTIKATEGEDFQRLGNLFIEKFKDELNNTQITAAAIVRGIEQLVASGHKTRAEKAAAAAAAAADKSSAILTVNLGSKGKHRIQITEGDDPQQLARTFCVRHGLGQEVFEKIVNSLTVLLNEAKVRGEAEAELEHMDQHYMNAVGCFLGVMLGIKLLMLMQRCAVGMYKRRQFQLGHDKAKQPDFLQKWDDTLAQKPKKPSKGKAGKSGNSPGAKAKVN